MEKELYISQGGHAEVFLVNETSEHVWFDDFTVETVHSPVVQETHYDPWGLELTGLGYQQTGVKENRYLYNGNEILSDLNLNLYDSKSRFYDPAIGRFTSVDVLADHPRQIGMSPYQFGWNNPIRYNDPDGKCPLCNLGTMGKVLYTGLQAKYSGILSQAQGSSQRLISGSRGSTPSGIGLSFNTQAAMRAAGVVSDVNNVMETGVALGKEVVMDAGTVLDKGGEVISDVGLALAIPTEGASLVLVPIGEGASMVGKSMKAGIHLNNGNVSGAKQEAVNLAIGALTNTTAGEAIKQSIKVGLIRNPIQEYIQKTALGTVGSGVNKTSSLINENIHEKDEE